MSLTQTNLVGVAKKQYLYKLKVHSNLIAALAGIQFFALMFTFGGTGMISSGTGNMSISITTFSGAVIITFPIIWAFMVAISLTTKATRSLDFAFVSSRLSSNLANAAFLLTLGGLGGVTVSLGGVLFRIILSGRGADVIGSNFYLAPRELLLTALVATLYLILISTLGYFIGTLVQKKMALVVIIPALVIGFLILEAGNPGISLITKGVEFFTAETLLGLFALKVLATSALLMMGATLASQRMEVRS